MPGNGAASAARRGAVGPRLDGAPFPAVAPVNPEVFGSDLTCSRNTHANQPRICAATATSCGAAEIASAVLRALTLILLDWKRR
jgi:hypothetical protein